MESLPQFVIKRNGISVPFDQNKISWAVKRCLRSQNQDTDENNVKILKIEKILARYKMTEGEDEKGKKCTKKERGRKPKKS